VGLRAIEAVSSEHTAADEEVQSSIDAGSIIIIPLYHRVCLISSTVTLLAILLHM